VGWSRKRKLRIYGISAIVNCSIRQLSVLNATAFDRKGFDIKSSSPRVAHFSGGRQFSFETMSIGERKGRTDRLLYLSATSVTIDD
jgi:hypothetical protein